jgi:hypothetical protein
MRRVSQHPPGTRQMTVSRSGYCVRPPPSVVAGPHLLGAVAVFLRVAEEERAGPRVGCLVVVPSDRLPRVVRDAAREAKEERAHGGMSLELREPHAPVGLG